MASRFLALGQVWTKLTGTAKRFVGSVTGETISYSKAIELETGLRPGPKSKAIKAGQITRRSSEAAATGRARQAEVSKTGATYLSAERRRKVQAAEERQQRKVDRQEIAEQARDQGASKQDAKELSRIWQKINVDGEHLEPEEWERYNKIDKRLKKKGIDAREIISPRRRRPARLAA